MRGRHDARMQTHMRPQTLALARQPKQEPQLPSDLAEVSLIDATACAKVGSMSVSWWHEQVAAGIAPQPVIRRPRCTRWHVGAVKAFWKAFADTGSEGSERLFAATAKASAASAAKRSAAPQEREA